MKKILSLMFLIRLFTVNAQPRIEGIIKAQQQQSNRYAVSLQELIRRIEQAINLTNSPYMTAVRNYLSQLPDVKDSHYAKSDKLVSDYAFRKLLKQNFHNVVLGENDVSKMGKYATIDLSNKPSFSFSPFVWETDPANRKFQHILSLNISGKLDSKGLFKINDYRDINAGTSWKIILNQTNYKTIAKPSTLKKYQFHLKEKIDALCDSYNEKIDLINKSSDLRKEEKQTEKKALSKAFIEDYTNGEIENAEEFWKSKNFMWISWDIDFFGYDRISYLNRDSLAVGHYQPLKKDFYTPDTKIGWNFYSINKKQASILLSVYVGLKIKHNLSEVFDPSDFQPYNRINDSLIKLKDVESVYITDFTDIKSKAVFDFGFRTVGMINLGGKFFMKKIGLSLSISRNGLVGNEEFPSLFRTETGIVFPFVDAKGESKLNLELFKRWDTYSNFPNSNSDFIGIRFNVPISN